MTPAAISVIMPTLNAAAHLREALASLAAQNASVEAVLVDGGSRDETLAIASREPGLRVISAPGTSIYDALNRGISETRAPAIVFLNADDALLPGAIEMWRNALAQAPECGIARGRATFVEAGGGGALVPMARANLHAARSLTIEAILRGPGAINTLCIRRPVFDRVGPFDTTYRLAADRDWMLRALRASIRITEFDRPVYRYLSHAGSSTFDRARRNYVLIRTEHRNIAARNLSEAPPINAAHVRALRRWHAIETGMLAWRQARALEAKRLASTLVNATSLDFFWPFTLVGEVVRCLTRRLQEEWIWEY